MLQKGLIIRFQMTIEDWFAWDCFAWTRSPGLVRLDWFAWDWFAPVDQCWNKKCKLKSKFNSESFVPETFLL